MKPLDRIFKALADPTRLRILNLLLKQPACVCELETLLQLPQPLISRHLAYLRSVSLVTDHRQGMRVQYAPVVEDAFGQLLQEFLQRAFQSRSVFREDVDHWRAHTKLEAHKVRPEKNRFIGGQP